MKKLTELEQFAWDNRDVPMATLADQLNRSENEIWKAYLRAERKVQSKEASS
jgi:hypothetical protein